MSTACLRRRDLADRFVRPMGCGTRQGAGAAHRTGTGKRAESRSAARQLHEPSHPALSKTTRARVTRAMDNSRGATVDRVSAVLNPAAFKASAGRSAPLGATLTPKGVNFSIFARHATEVELLFFDRENDARPARVFRIDPASRTYHYWHTFVPGARAGQIYGYRVHGPDDPAY